MQEFSNYSMKNLHFFRSKHCPVQWLKYQHGLWTFNIFCKVQKPSYSSLKGMENRFSTSYNARSFLRTWVWWGSTWAINNKFVHNLFGRVLVHDLTSLFIFNLRGWVHNKCSVQWMKRPIEFENHDLYLVLFCYDMYTIDSQRVIDCMLIISSSSTGTECKWI